MSEKLPHLEAIREDVRDEVKRRIQQRDQYSMQLTVALGAIAVGAFSSNGTPRLFILAPLVVIYFTGLILYSYRIHDMLMSYLQKEIEPEFQALTELPTAKEWETWYQAQGRKPGICQRAKMVSWHVGSRFNGSIGFRWRGKGVGIS
jgi:hypothetical protein